VRLVSFSVDPENDTPPVLSRYAEQVHADTGRWSFVTGPVDDVSKAVVLGFKVSAAKVAAGANDYDVTHGDWFVLVDAKGQIRGYYATAEESDFEVLVQDALRLERRGR
jgi:protein SCO1/2